ncbi:MAG: class I SAM-dependent methyltransferase [Bacteroidota bacterium]|nr:class I SAM-dependent methyltransferase [Bacteroidota bacterium]
MNFIYYFKYFFFIGINWNFPLAFFTIYHEIKGELKYRINTIRLDRLHNLEIKGNNLTHASIYQGANYYVLKKAFSYLKSINANDNIVDFGSGKGRAMAVAANYGFKNITGIDFSSDLCKDAEKNIEGIQSSFPSANFKIICDDATHYKIETDDQVFFFFNPFDEVIMLQVAKNILLSLKQKPRQIYIVYVNPLHKEIFLSAGFEEEYYLKKLKYIELSLLSNEPDE